ncbi:MAG: DNA polymerase [Planctomycetales bacterium]
MITQSPSSIVVDYALDGERSAAAVARGESRLVGIAIHDETEPKFYTNPGAILDFYRQNPRVYPDALLARVVETVYQLPHNSEYDCIRTMTRLLELSPAGRGLPVELFDPSTPAPGSPTDFRGNAMRNLNAILSALDALLPALESECLEKSYWKFEIPTIDPVAALIAGGVGVDADLIRRRAASHAREAAESEARIRALAGPELNLNYHEAMTNFFFGELGLPVVHRTSKGKPALTDEVLGILGKAHPIATLFLRYRRSTIAARTYGSLSRSVSASDRIHPDLDPLGTETGRFNCEDPNLQGLSQDERQTFVADPGCVFVEGEVSQAEFRVLALLSGYHALSAAFHAGGDVHRRAAAIIYGVKETDVVPEQRKVAKAVNFAVLYGQTVKSLSRSLGWSPSDADKLFNAFWDSFPGVRDWTYHASQAAFDGCVTTISGRKRRLPPICSNRTGKTLRQAVNTVVQGSSADLLKVALATLYDRLPSDCRILMTVHDSILVQAPESKASETAALVRETMETCVPPDFNVPMKADVTIGRRWGEPTKTLTE